jgi:hypothetical protein
MGGIFHLTVAADERGDVGGVCLIGGQAGDAVGGLGSFRVAVQVGGHAADAEGLEDAAEV